MSGQSPVISSDVRSVFESNGYSRLIGSLTIGEISLEIDEVWMGPEGTLDLAVVYPRPSSRADESKIYWEVQRLVRALDAAGSQRTITTILVGPSEPFGPELRKWESELQSLARVLFVDGHLPVARSLAPLRRLVLPSIEERIFDGVELLHEAISGVHQAPELRTLLAAAKDGPQSVEARYFSWIEQAFALKGETR